MNKQKEECVILLLKVLALTKDLKPGESKEIECPACHKKMICTKAKENGHLWAKCETENCIRISQ